MENQRDPNKDITEVLGFKEHLEELERTVQESSTETQRNLVNKMNIMINYRHNAFIEHLRRVYEKSYSDLNVIII
jgi:hypothetical protein